MVGALALGLMGAAQAHASTVQGLCGSASLELVKTGSRTVRADVTLKTALNYGGISGYAITVTLQGTGSDRLNRVEVLTKGDLWGGTTTASVSLQGKQQWGVNTTVSGVAKGKITLSKGGSCTLDLPFDYEFIT
jgi:hypothetical protein